MPYFGKSGKNFFLLEKNPTSSFKIGGIRSQKSFFDFYENLQQLSLVLDKKNTKQKIRVFSLTVVPVIHFSAGDALSKIEDKWQQ